MFLGGRLLIKAIKNSDIQKKKFDKRKKKNVSKKNMKFLLLNIALDAATKDVC